MSRGWTTVAGAGLLTCVGLPAQAAADNAEEQRVAIHGQALGKFGAVDVFDTNRHAHDPRGDFLDWSVIDAGSFDYAAEAWGYTYGVAVEGYRGPWTVRAGDRIGIAASVNGISAVHRAYLANGGLGVLVGDGRLPRYGAEGIGEACYQWEPADHVAVALDYQLVGNPGDNRDRGPANVAAVRIHGEF